MRREAPPPYRSIGDSCTTVARTRTRSRRREERSQQPSASPAAILKVELQAGLRACEHSRIAFPQRVCAAVATDPRERADGRTLSNETIRLPLRGQRRLYPEGAPASRFIPVRRC